MKNRLDYRAVFFYVCFFAEKNKAPHKPGVYAVQ